MFNPDSPLVTLTLGSTLNPHDIKEGDDVYFECNVRANPREHRISWYHNVSLILHIFYFNNLKFIDNRIFIIDI